MRFDDGFVTFYRVVNLSDDGDIPEKGLTKKADAFFHEETVGITRFYEALKADQQIERVISIYADGSLSINDIAEIDVDDPIENQYIIRMIQRAEDENGIKIMRLSLERFGEAYEVID